MNANVPTPEEQATMRRNISQFVHPSQGLTEDNVDFILSVIQPIVLPDP